MNFDNTNVNGLGNVTNFVGVSNSIDLNKVSSVFRGNNEAYVLSVTSRLESSIIEANSSQKQEIQTSNSSGAFFNAVLKVLKDKANIVDERIRYY